MPLYLLANFMFSTAFRIISLLTNSGLVHLYGVKVPNICIVLDFFLQYMFLSTMEQSELLYSARTFTSSECSSIPFTQSQPACLPSTIAVALEHPPQVKMMAVLPVSSPFLLC